MKKIVNPCTFDYVSTGDVFCRIEFDEINNKLSITGVEGPKRNGNCMGSCGQIADLLLDEKHHPNEKDGWTREMLEKLVEIWNEWHLNDMRPYCIHQKELGWDKKAKEKVPIYHYTLKTDIFRKRSDIQNNAWSQLKTGKAVRLTPENLEIVNLDLSITSHEKIDNPYYEPDIKGFHGFEGTKLLGCLHPDEHPEGILTKECPVCGYKYGTKWLKEDVPEDVIEWLFNLPDAKKEPAWV